ncbi:MAG TPA: host specificity factor TipJ family phage tail protein [Rhizomicrobium sp.]|jgi:hypothetical protein|nr:host specificity factor TipJ family phage tail protein [Rhizomicrobium sp.]
MTKTVTITRDVFDRSSWQQHEVEDVADFLALNVGRWSGDRRHWSWPENTRLYHRAFAQDCDVTPSDRCDLEALNAFPGPFFLEQRPGSWQDVASVLLAPFYALLGLLVPKPAALNQNVNSSNNQLGDRQNKARLLGRIPDIFGEKRSTPDDLMVPLRIFDSSGNESELSYFGVSRGELDVSDIRDGDTLVSEIEGETVEVYAPFTSPNSGDDPQLRVGNPIGMGVVTVLKSNGINGQTLYPPNYKSYTSDATAPVLRFRYPNFIISTDDDNLNFTKFAEAGAGIVLSGAHADDGSGHVVNLDGSYTIDTVSNAEMTLVSPASVNSDWTIVNAMASHQTPVIPSCTLDASGLTTKVVGPVIVDDATVTGAIANLVQPGGSFKTDGSDSFPVAVTVRFGVTPVDASGAPTGPEVTTDITLPGSGVDKTQRAASAALTLSGRSSLRAWRTTPTDYFYKGTVTDEIKWRDLFATAPVAMEDFGNITTMLSLTRVTPTALGVKERKLTALVCRRVAVRDGDGFLDTLAASKNAADVFCALALDPYNGRRSLAELNVAQIYDTVAAVGAYFGDTSVMEFGFSFDDDQMPAEEELTSVAQAIFCTALRRGAVLELVFESETPDSSMLFNHRNKLPGSEKRTMRFGALKDYDGVELNYVDSGNFDAAATYRIPTDGSAGNPQKIDTVGVRNFRPAAWLAWRAYWKSQLQRLAVEFDATEQAAVVAQSERILNADNTRPGTQDGEVIDQDGLALTLSRKPIFAPETDYLIMLQIPDGTVDVISIVPGPSPKTVLLAEAPSSSLSIEIRNAARAAYWIVPDIDTDLGRAFLVAEKTPNDAATYKLSVINYDRRYYQNDTIDPV